MTKRCEKPNGSKRVRSSLGGRKKFAKPISRSCQMSNTNLVAGGDDEDKDGCFKFPDAFTDDQL